MTGRSSLRYRVLLAPVRRLAARQPLTIEGARRRNGPPSPDRKPPRDLRVEATEIAGVPVEVYVPVDGVLADGTLVYVHGGGLISGTPATQRHLPRSFMRRLRMRTISVDYRLAPEHPFPAGIEDLAAVLSALADTARPLVLVGDSAGATITLGALQLVHAAGGGMPERVVLLWPLTDLTGSGRSAETNVGRDVMRPESLPLIRNAYLDGHAPDEPLVSPHFADLAFLPPTFVQVGDADLLLDDARRLATRLTADGVDCTLSVWPHMVHAFSAVGELFPESRAAHDELAAWVLR